MHIQFPRKLVLVGVLLSLIPIGLGIAGLVTPVWVKTLDVRIPANISGVTYSFLIDQNTLLPSNETLYTAAQGLEIGGVCCIAVGVVVIVLLDVFLKYRWFQLAPSLLIYIGSVAILVGLLLYLLAVVDYAAGRGQKLDVLGYSSILMIVSSLVGFLTAVYFSFTTGIGIHQSRIITQKFVRAPHEIEQYTERF